MRSLLVEHLPVKVATATLAVQQVSHVDLAILLLPDDPEHLLHVVDVLQISRAPHQVGVAPGWPLSVTAGAHGAEGLIGPCIGEIDTLSTELRRRGDVVGCDIIRRLQRRVLNLQIVYLAMLVRHQALLVEVLVHRVTRGTNRHLWYVLTIFATLPSLAFFGIDSAHSV